MNTTNIISVSSGKDSTAMLLLAIEQDAENLRAVFADTGHEHRLTYEYLDYLELTTGIRIEHVKADFAHAFARKRRFIAEKWTLDGVSAERVTQALALLHPTGIPFLDLCMLKGRFPSTKARFCSLELKHNPIDQQIIIPALAQYSEVISWQGVRADESRSRRDLPESEEHPSRWGLTTYRPILHWNVEEVFAMHRKHNIKPNPLYTLGMGRVGCMPCIHARKDELLEIGRRFPEEVARVALWERLVSDVSKRGSASFFAPDKTPGEHVGRSDIPMPGIKQVIQWSRTSHGGKQIDMLRSDDSNIALCSSIYGLCE